MRAVLDSHSLIRIRHESVQLSVEIYVGVTLTKTEFSLYSERKSHGPNHCRLMLHLCNVILSNYKLSATFYRTRYKIAVWNEMLPITKNFVSTNNKV